MRMGRTLGVAIGKVIGQCLKRHRHREWLKFLRRIKAETLPYLNVHLIVDNNATYKHPRGQSVVHSRKSGPRAASGTVSTPACYRTVSNRDEAGRSAAIGGDGAAPRRLSFHDTAHSTCPARQKAQP